MNHFWYSQPSSLTHNTSFISNCRWTELFLQSLTQTIIIIGYSFIGDPECSFHLVWDQLITPNGCIFAN